MRKQMPERAIRNEEDNARAIRTKPNQERPQLARGIGDEEAEAQAEANSESAKTSERIKTLRKLKPGERKSEIARGHDFESLKKGEALRGRTK